MPKGGGGGGRAGGGGRTGRARYGGGGTPTDRLNQMGVSNFAVINLKLYNTDVDVAQIVANIPEGSTFLGEGNTAFALRLPDGDVMRIQYTGQSLRPNITVMLQSTSTTHIGNALIERTPYVRPASRMSWAQQEIGSRYIYSHTPRGWSAVDLHPDNYGKTANGRWVVLDPGTFKHL